MDDSAPPCIGDLLVWFVFVFVTTYRDMIFALRGGFLYDTIRCYCTTYNHAVDIVFLYKVFVWGKECLVLRLFRIILSIYLRYTGKITIFVDMYALLEGF